MMSWCHQIYIKRNNCFLPMSLTIWWSAMHMILAYTSLTSKNKGVISVANVNISERYSGRDEFFDVKYIWALQFISKSKQLKEAVCKVLMLGLATYGPRPRPTSTCSPHVILVPPARPQMEKKIIRVNIMCAFAKILGATNNKISQLLLGPQW